MSQAKRKKKNMRGSTLNGFLLLCLGMVLGSVLTVLYQGYRTGDGSALGSGLRDFVANRTVPASEANAPAAESTPEPAAPQVNVGFHETLAKDEDIVPRIEKLVPPAQEAEPRVKENTEAAVKAESVAARVPDRKTEASSDAPEKMRVAQLQVGSFRKREDAQRLKIQIALKGLTANVEPGTVNGEKMWRVRLGPYRVDDGTLNQVRSVLVESGMKTLEVGVTTIQQ